MQTTMRMFAVPNANIFRRRKDFPLHFGKKATGLILLTATVYIYIYIYTILYTRITYYLQHSRLCCNNFVGRLAQSLVFAVDIVHEECRIWPPWNVLNLHYYTHAGNTYIDVFNDFRQRL